MPPRARTFVAAAKKARSAVWPQRGIAVAMKAGASDYMMKPFDRDILEAKFLPQTEELAEAG